MRNYFRELKAIEADAAKTKRALRLYEEGGMGWRILTRRLARLREQWKETEAARRAEALAAIDGQISPNGTSAHSCH